MQRYPAARFIFLVFFFVFQVFYPVLTDIGLLHAQDDCTVYLKAAQDHYYDGKFDEAIELIKSCLKLSPKSPELQFQSLKILSQAYLAKDYREAAREVARKLVELNPDYAPTIEQEPPPFIVLIDEVKKEKGLSATPVSGEPGFFEKNRSLLWIVGGGAALIGLTALLAAGGNDKKESKPLAQPPDWPDTP